MAKMAAEPEPVEVPEPVPQSIEEPATEEISQTNLSPIPEPSEVETTPVQPEGSPEQPQVSEPVPKIVETETTEKQEPSPVPEPAKVEATTIHSEEVSPGEAQTVEPVPEVAGTETAEGQISSPIPEPAEVGTTPVQPEGSPEQPQVSEPVPELEETGKEEPSPSVVSESEVETISLGPEEESSEQPQAAEPIPEVTEVETAGEQAESPVPEAQVDTIQPEGQGPMEVQKTETAPEVVKTETTVESVPTPEQEPEPVESRPATPEATPPEEENLIGPVPVITEVEQIEVEEQVPEADTEAERPSPEQEESLSELQGSVVPVMGEGVEEVPFEASGMAEETVTTLDLPSELACIEGEPRALVLMDQDVQISVRESTCKEVQKIGGINAVIPAEQACVPAVIDDECQLSIPAGHGLPALVDVETAIAVPSSESRSLSSVEAEKESVRAPAAEISAIEAIPLVVQSTPKMDGVVIVPEPLIEVPLEPEIPISDRELKAAIILNILGENARALDEIDRYIREKSGSHDARHIKAIILDDMGRLTECLEELKEAIQLDPRDEIALMDIESISRRLGRREESMLILASISPSKEVRAREATNMLESKRYDEIVAKFSSPGPLDTPVTKMASATSLMVQGRYREAYRVLKEILLEHPTYPEALNNMGVCMRFMGEYAYDEPMHFMKLAVEADPNYGDAWNNIGATLFVLGEYDAAMEAIRKAVAVDRRSDYLVNLSKCQVMVGDIAGAKLSLTSALKYEETAEIDFALGMIAEKEGDLKWALKLYDSAIELVPNFKDAIFNRQRVRLFLKYMQK
jgi:tetratricopeptide (TPR) repeat protein